VVDVIRRHVDRGGKPKAPQNGTSGGVHAIETVIDADGGAARGQRPGFQAVERFIQWKHANVALAQVFQPALKQARMHVETRKTQVFIVGGNAVVAQNDESLTSPLTV